ncbi:MAG: amidohydrolase [Bryobacteraceae bacterium]|nr:amidohydrolase [Bryobacteraceae bacterium]
MLAALALLAADLTLNARYVVTMDAQRRVIENGSVVVREGAIVSVGERKLGAVELGDVILMPGLINAHTHAPMALFRGVADDLTLNDWLTKFIFPAEARNLTPEFIRWGTRLAMLEMLLSGITTYVDMYYFQDLIAEETKRAGMRGILGQTIIRFPVADHKTPEAALEFAEKYIVRFQGDPLITPAVSPHALYTNKDETLRRARAIANQHKAPLLIHLAETKKELDDIRAARKMSPAQTLSTLGVLDGWTIAAHSIWVDDADLALLQRHRCGVAHCPSSNMKLASGIAPVLKMFRLAIPVGLGTDGPAGSNNDFNLFEEMDLASKLAKVSTMDPTALPARKAVEMATIEGSRAIGLDAKIGSIEPGKRADLIAVRLDQPHATPMFDVYSQLVYALKASDVSDVMVEGKWLVRARKPLTLDAAAIRAKAAEYRASIGKSLVN